MYTWDLVDLPAGGKAIPGKWVYDKKLKPDGTLDRFRARWVDAGTSRTRPEIPSTAPSLTSSAYGSFWP